MNAIISLCHFCELHGPKVLFCTQPFHPEEKFDVGEPEADASDGQVRRSVTPSLSETSGPTIPACISLPHYKNDLCEGCTSVHLGFVSHDDDAGVSYVSSQRPQHRDVFSMIRQACIRSLSCEVCPGGEGPIFFGGEQQGHTISYTFYISDNQARGFKRLYSILVVMMDKIYLLNSWPFLVAHMETVVKHLKDRANVVYEDEKVKYPQPHYRLSSNVTPKNYIQQRGGNKPARSLAELTNDKNIFKILHTSFVWILKACGNRLSETLLEGPPTEESIIDMEKQEETEEGFVKLFSKKLAVSNNGTEENETRLMPAGCQLIQEVTEDDGSPEIKDLRHLLNVLGASRFHILAHHVVIGNQVILRGSGKTLIRTILDTLTYLLPKGCYRTIPYSNVYVESYKCNFLGLTPATTLPPDVHTSEQLLLIDVYDPPVDAINTSSDNSDGLENYTFKFSSFVTLPEKAPTVLTKMLSAIENETLCMEVVEHCLICFKEEWMNKVKVVFKFKKAGGGRSDEDTRNLLKIVGATEVDKPLLGYWMGGLSDQYKKHVLSASKNQVQL